MILTRFFLMWLSMQSPAVPAQAVALYEDDQWSEVVWMEELKEREWREAEAVWVWSGVLAPTRLVEPPESVQSTADQVVLTVRLPTSARRGTALLVAAPRNMWEEVPEELLPMWDVPESGVVELPRRPGDAWRVRWLDAERGSLWAEVGEDQAQVLLSARSADNLQITVKDSEGTPLERAALFVGEAPSGELAQTEEGRWLTRARADETGAVVLPSLPPTGILAWEISAPGYVPWIHDGAAGTLPTEVRLDTGCALEGRVVAPDGRPVPRAEVRFSAWSSQRTGRLFQRRCLTDDRGRFRLAGLPDGQSVLEIKATGHAPFQRMFETHREVKDLGDFPLTPERPVEVWVTGAGGVALEGALVETHQGESVFTDNAGLAVLREQPLEVPLRLNVTAPGYLEQSQVLAAPSPTVVRLSLRQAFRVTGRLLDADGELLKQAQVVAKTEVGERARYRRAEQDEDGFELLLDEERDYVLTLRSPVTVPKEIEIKTGAVGETRDLGEVHLGSGRMVVGRVVEAQSGRPIPDAWIWTPDPAHGNPQVAWLQNRLLRVRTDEQGHFRLAGLAPQQAVVRVDAPGFARGHLSLPTLLATGDEVPTSHTEDVGDVTLTAGSSLEIHLRRATAISVTATVDLRERGLEMDMLRASFSGETGVLSQIPPGEHRVTVTRGDAVLCDETVTLPSAGSVGRLDCAGNPMVVTGLVTDNDRVAGAGVLNWQEVGDGSVPDVSLRSVTPQGLPQTVHFGLPRVEIHVDDGGTFTTNRLHPGTWEVTWSSAEGVWGAPQTVQVPDAERALLELRFDGIRLDDSLPEASAEVTLLQSPP